MMGKVTLVRLLLVLSCAICFAATCEEVEDDNGDTAGDGNENGDEGIDPGAFFPNDPNGCMMCMTSLAMCALPCIPSCMGIPGT